MEKVTRFLLCCAGLILSCYAFYVEHAKYLNEEYEALCDISSFVSCSAVFTSEYGTGFGIVHRFFGKQHFLNQPNSIFGMIYFVIQMTGLFITNRTMWNMLYYLTWVGIFTCLYLAYVLIFILHDICVVCISTYGLTFFLHYLNYQARKRFHNSGKKLK